MTAVCLVLIPELSDPFSEPLYEKILRSVKNIKSNVTAIMKAHQGKVSSAGGKNFEDCGAQSLCESIRALKPYYCYNNVVD